MIEYRPLPKQEVFHRSNADITLAAGGAGSSKTFGMLAELARYVNVPGYNAIVFRRTYPEIIAPGGLWDQAGELYMGLKARQRVQSPRRYIFPSGAKVTFSHLQKASDKEKHKGGQYHTICFDELSTFDCDTFIYLMSRNRSPLKEKARILATTNPVSGTWLSDMIEPYLDRDGYPDDEYQGKIMWLNVGDDGKPRLNLERQSDSDRTFMMVSSTVYDNPVLLESNPHYTAALENLHLVERERLLKGNWAISYEAGTCFNKDDFSIVGETKAGGIVAVGFDLAGTAATASGDPDYTAAVIVHKVDGRYIVMDIGAKFLSPGAVGGFVKEWVQKAKMLARNLGAKALASFEIEPGGAGKRDFHYMSRIVEGIPVVGAHSLSSKIDRAKPLMRDVELGRVSLLTGKWNADYISHMHAIPDGRYDDLMDATVVCHYALSQTIKSKTRGSSYI